MCRIGTFHKRTKTETLRPAVGEGNMSERVKRIELLALTLDSAIISATVDGKTVETSPCSCTVSF